MRKTSPCKLHAIEPITIVAGPMTNLKTIPNKVNLAPQAINLSCNAMKSPARAKFDPNTNLECLSFLHKRN